MARVNVVLGGAEAGIALAHHRDVQLLSFTDSTQTGKRLLIAAGESNMKRLVLECGGKAPNIVFEDCPHFAAAADSIAARAFWNQGQVYTASSRLLLQKSIKGKFLPILLEKIAALRPGDPLDPETRFGPLVSAGHRKKVLHYIERGEKEGARVIHRGDGAPPHAQGFYVAPVVFDCVSPRLTIAQEEIFGPVLSVLSFDDEDDAIRIANDSIYGLSAILWTTNAGRAHRMSQALDAGWIVVNATPQPRGGPASGVVSIGGHKESGVGVEGGVGGIKSYLRESAVQLFV